MPDTPDTNPTLPDDPLTEDERAEQTEQTEIARTAYEAVRRKALELSAALLVLLRRRLFREHGGFAAFVEATFEFSADYGYKHTRWARLNEALTAAGEDPLEVESHAREITPLLKMVPDSDHVSEDALARTLRAVRTAHAAAAAEGTRLAARHLKDARKAVEAERAAADLAEAQAELDALDGARGAPTGDGLHVLGPDGLVTAWSDNADYDADPAATAPLVPLQVDEASGVAYPVLLPAPGETARTWAPGSDGFRAAYLPGRLGTPAPADAGAQDRDRVVLVAPGVDPLHDGVPDRVLDEVTAAVGSDPSRLYLVRTEHVERAAARRWPPNVSLVVEARTADQLVELSGHVRAAVEAGFEAPWTAVLRDLVAPPPDGFGDLLGVFAWVLVRGKATSWWTLGALYDAVPRDALHVGREVHARPTFSPLLPDLGTPVRHARAAAPIRTVRRRTGGPALPPIPAP